MKAKNICMILSVGIISLSAVACGNANTEAIETKSIEVVVEEKSISPEEIVNDYVKHTIENYPEYGVVEGETSFEAIELVNSVTIKNWNDGKAVQLETAYVVTSADEAFKGVIIKGICEEEDKIVYFYTDDSGKIVSEDGIKLTSFLPAAKLKEIQ